MSDGMKDAFNSTGLAHVLSISGTHFGIFSVLLFGLFRLVIKFLPYSLLQRITLYVTPSQGAAALSLPFMLAYLALSGWSIPAVRSFIMISLFLIGLLIGRKRFWLNSLLFAAFVIVLWNPEALFSLSFQLSFLAVLFIGFSIDYEKDKEHPEVQESKGADEQKILPRFFRFFTQGIAGFCLAYACSLSGNSASGCVSLSLFFGYLSAVQSINHAADRFCALAAVADIVFHISFYRALYARLSGKDSN